MKQKNLVLTVLFFISLLAYGQRSDGNGMMYLNENRRPLYRDHIKIPNVNGYEVVKCDFHMHTVFSDGHVWPNIRNQEAWEEGLDAIAITDHIEYQPHKEDVKVNHNRGYEILKDGAAKNNIILVRGTEITRNTPPGHFNAIYINDASDFIEDRTTNENDKAAVMKASEQNAFIFWNHPGWKPNIKGSYEWIDFVDDLYRNKALHGIEVINGFGFHMKALDWCIDKGLTVMGTSDIHNLIAHDYDLSKDYVHRTMTLVLAKDRTPESIREALDAGRTVAWASKLLVGKEENVSSLFNACVLASPSHYTEITKNGDKIKYYEIRNISDLYFELEFENTNSSKNVILYPQSTILVAAKDDQTALTGSVKTAFIRSNQNLSVNIPLN